MFDPRLFVGADSICADQSLQVCKNRVVQSTRTQVNILQRNRSLFLQILRQL